jgi:hypothetical protein
MPSDWVKGLQAAMKKTRANVIGPSAKNVMTMKATAVLTGIETVVANETVKKIANALVAIVLSRETKVTLPDDICDVPNVAIAMGTTPLKKTGLPKEAQLRLKIHIH